MTTLAPIWIGNDHGGFQLKEEIVAYLESKGISYHNIGSDSPGEIVRYPYYAAEVAKMVATGKTERGILICSTGIGMSIVANRFPGVRAALCTSTYMGRMTRAHNNSNLLCLGGMLTAKLEALDILKVWLETEYEGGRHNISLDLIGALDSLIDPPLNGKIWSEEKL